MNPTTGEVYREPVIRNMSDEQKKNLVEVPESFIRMSKKRRLRVYGRNKSAYQQWVDNRKKT